MASEATSTIRCRVFAVSAFDFLIALLQDDRRYTHRHLDDKRYQNRDLV
jgi:hypothetical protein